MAFASKNTARIGRGIVGIENFRGVAGRAAPMNSDSDPIATPANSDLPTCTSVDDLQKSNRMCETTERLPYTGRHIDSKASDLHLAPISKPAQKLPKTRP